MAEPEDIIQVCRDMRAVQANANDCNLFAKAVCAKFNVVLTGNADAIMGQIAGPEWTQHGNDGVAAAAAATAGELVVGGMTSQALGGAHGHVVIVVDGPLNRDLYPTAYWGSLNPSIRPNGAAGTTLNFSFSAGDRDNVVYASRSV